MKVPTFSNHSYSFIAFLLVFLFPISSLSLYANEDETVTCISGASVNTFPYNESFEGNTGLWTQNTGDDGNWTLNSGNTPSNTTGPSGAFLGNDYLYTEASNGGGNLGSNANVILTSPCIDLTSETEAYFSFNYHMYGSNMGSLQVEVSSNAGGLWTPIFTISGQQQTSSTAAWSSATIDLSSYAGNTINLRFSGTTGNGWRSDMAIDNIGITASPEYCDSFANNTDPSGITRVIFNTIDNSTTPAAQGYSDFTGISTTVGQGTTHDLSVHNNTLGNNLFYTRVWIDWNQDFDFDDAGETYDLGTAQNEVDGPTTNSPLAITVPTGATLGTTRMRVSSFFSTIPTSCLATTVGSGEVEDYTINVNSPTPQPEIAITGLGILINSGDTTPNPSDNTDYGIITSGGTLNHTFTIQNTGTLALNLSGATLTGPGASEFTLTPPAASVPVGGTANFVIAYNPSSGGIHNATFTVNTNDSDENPYNFAIRGEATGPQPEITLDGLGNLINDGATTTLPSNGTDFGATVVTNPITRTFTINNIGSANLNLTSASPYVVVSGSPFFTLSIIPTSTIIPGGGSTTFEITYNPISIGTHTATISIANNDSDENPFDFTVTGQSVATAAPEIDIAGNGASIIDGDNTPSITDDTDFGTIFLGNSNINDFTITNTGTDDLILGAPMVQITGAGAAAYSITSLPNATLVPGASSTFQISYEPTAVSTSSARVTVRSNDTDEAIYRFDITGTAVLDTNPRYTIYYEGFDTSNGGWTATNPGGNSVWTYGVNASEPGTEGNHWYTSNYDDYAPNSNTYATSPTIDLTGYNNLKLLIDIRYVTQLNGDGMRVEYYDGSSWSTLGAYSATPLEQWYNTDSVAAFGSGQDGWSGVNTGGAGGGRSDFLRAAIALPTSLENNNAVRLRVRFASNGSSNDNGANFDNVVILGDPITPFTNPTEGPASVNTNLKLWLKSDAGTGGASSGTPISAWNDLAFDNHAQVANNDAPIYYNNALENINHNPVLNFSTSNDTELKGKGGFYTDEYWVVIQNDNIINAFNSQEGVLSGRTSLNQFGEDGTGLWLNPGSRRFIGQDNIISHMIGSTPSTASAATDGSYGRGYVSSTDTMDNEVLILNVKYNAATNQSEIYRNGQRIDNYTGRAYDNGTGTIGGELPYHSTKNSNYVLGVGRITIAGTPFDSHFNGKMTEFISYASPSSSFDQKKIQSYLALKNGITLHSINSVTDKREGDENYIDSDGNIYWDTTVNNGFNYDIAGIGRDIDATLDQKQSTSSNAGSIITMGLTDIYNTNSENISTNTNTIGDKNFLVWGNNNESFAAATPIVVDMSANIGGLSSVVDFISIRRTWKVQETGNIGRVKISIPETSLTATITPPGNFLMFVSDTPTFNPSSEYRVLTANGANLETTYDFVGTKYITFGYAPEYIYNRAISFDGTQDYMDADDVADLTGPFTLSAWVKPNAGAGNSVIISKKNTAPWTAGYSLGLSSSLVPRMEWMDATNTARGFNASVALPIGEWHHVAVIYDGTTATFYIDGVEDTNYTAPAPNSSGEHFMIAAANYLAPSNFFEGTIDEVRVWNNALAQDQLRFIMNQEIEQFSDASVTGSIIPQSISKNEVASIPWGTLEIYLPMNRYTFTNVKDESDNNHVAAIKNLETVDYQTAPLPYISTFGGEWTSTSTWENGSGFQVPGAASIVDPAITVDWNIVETNHNITVRDYTSVLALDVTANELTVTDDRFLNISHYLRLDGTLDLEGESQLIQTLESDLELTSIGRLERDQQGTIDTYSYNFFSSPVGPVNNSAINQPYHIGGVMNDGTDPLNPSPLNFSGGLNGAATSPITISAYWLYTFANTAGGNNAWIYTGSFGNIETGLGYTMKGPGTSTADQNYVFIGKPNNSTIATPISHTIGAGNNTLVGNPFPSALDADQFINDNPHLTGTLYFWEHWGGGTHNLVEYEGGYAMYNLSGGVPAVSHPLVAQGGVGTTTPTPNIAVGQGFFVMADTAGNIDFNNGQRTFALESVNSTFFFGEPHEGNAQANSAQSNEDDVDPYLLPEEDLRLKFRIGYDSPRDYHRQILLTVDDATTFGIDRAYDAVIRSAPAEDMNWIVDEENVGIQGVPNLTDQVEFPLRVATAIEGNIKIGLDHMENVDPTEIIIFLKDHLLNESYNLYTAPHELFLEAGEYTDRFSIVFRTHESQTETEDTEEETNEEEEEETTDSEGTGGTDDNEEEEETTNENSEEQTDNEESEDESDTTDEEANTDMEVIEIVSTTSESLELTEMHAHYNSLNDMIIVRKNWANEFKSVRLFSMLGQVIKTWSPDKNSIEAQLPVNNLSTGTYILDIETTHGMFTKKLIIH